MDKLPHSYEDINKINIGTPEVIARDSKNKWSEINKEYYDHLTNIERTVYVDFKWREIKCG